jgi:hypothetical protein
VYEKGSRSYSLGIIIVAMTVGSQQAAIRFPGFEAKAAGFSTCTLLPSPYSKIYGTVGIVDMT